MSKKIIHNKKLSNQKKAFRVPVAPATRTFKDKSKYSRKEKYKVNYK